MVTTMAWAGHEKGSEVRFWLQDPIINGLESRGMHFPRGSAGTFKL